MFTIIVALPAATISDVSNLDGDYVGLLFAGGSSGDELFPVSVSLSGGSGTGAQITNHDSGALSADTVTITLDSSVDDPSDGFIKGTIDDGVGSGDMVAMAAVNVNGSGKNFIFFIGDNPGENGMLYNMLLISK